MEVIDYDAAMGVLEEVADCPDKTFAIWLLDWAASKRSFDGIPMSVITDIKSDIKYDIDRLSEKLDDDYISTLQTDLIKAQIGILNKVLTYIDKNVKETIEQYNK